MDYRLVNSRPEQPTTVILAGHPMARGFSSARTGSSRATTTAFCAFHLRWERPATGRTRRRTVATGLVAGWCWVAVLRKTPNLKRSLARKKERDDAIVVEEDPRFTRLWVVDVDCERARCLTTGEREVRSFAWTPDSRPWSRSLPMPPSTMRHSDPVTSGISVEGVAAASRGSALLRHHRSSSRPTTDRRCGSRPPPRSTRRLDLDGRLAGGSRSTRCLILPETSRS